MIGVKEICAEISVENDINLWLEKNKDKKIIDIKYSSSQYHSSALIVYETEEK